MIRLLFHDCVVTGCDGCVQMDNVENNGLDGIGRELDRVYNVQLNESAMSRADFYALAAVVAIRVASENQDCRRIGLPPNCTKPVPEMNIVYGRKDCATSPNSLNDFGFPDAHRDLDHVMEIFREGLGMTERQVVAIIGAHTMGSASPQNSGFQGPWAPPTNRFDNGFYRMLISNNSQWRQSRLNIMNTPAGLNPRFQWDLGTTQRSPGGNLMNMGPAPAMMLNTDMVNNKV